jgi:mono/diheme cytochrome c family protein
MARKATFLGLILLLLAVLAGCGGAGGNAPKPTVEGIPTPQGAFAQATTVITPPAAAAAAQSADSGDPVAGKTVYDNKCASCHGAKGEGVEGKGKGVSGWTMTAADFDDILRTGAKGKLGNEHLYGASQISPSGMENLFAFVRSLQKK